MAKQRILDTGNTISLERPSVHVPRNYFDRSHQVKGSGNMGVLYPILVDECLPGDEFHITSEILTRLQPMLAPVYQNFIIRVEYFNVDNILLWPKFYEFISPTQGVSVPPAMPFLNEPYGDKDLAAWLGCPNTGSDSAKVQAFKFAAYQCIVGNWYSDEDLQHDLTIDYTLVDGDNGANFANLNALRFRNHDRDYFRSAKPWQQKGAPVLIPLVQPDGVGSGFIPVQPIVDGAGHVNEGQMRVAATQVAAGAGNLQVNSTPQIVSSAFTAQPLYYDPNFGLGMATSDINGVAALINDLRTAEAVQKFLETDLIGGSRYPEMTVAQFGVHNNDRRMFRPEFLGMYSMNIAVSEVLNTTGTDTAPQGSMAGHGIALRRHPDGIHFEAKEHGWVFGIVSVIPQQPGYYQGLPKDMLRFDRYDYGWPLLAELGMQVIQNKEIYFTGGDGITDDLVWGYIVRYAEYRMAQSRVVGDFRTSLDFWQLDNKFEALPPLSDEFLQCRPTADMMRIFAVIDESVDHVLFYAHHDVKVLRALPRLVSPGIS